MSDVPADPPNHAAPHDPGSTGFWWIPGGLLASAGAAIVLWLVWPPNEDVRDLANEIAVGLEPEPGPDTARADLPTQAEPPPPSYVLETDGGLEQLRGDTGETSGGGETSETGSDPEPGRHRYRRDTPFEWVLRSTSHAGAGPAVGVGIRAFAFVDGGSAGLPLSLDPLVEVIEPGAIQITGKIGQLGLEPGRYTIALAVGRADALPTQAADVDTPSPEATPNPWVVRRVEIVIEE